MAMQKNTKTANTKTERKPKREYLKAADAVGMTAYLESGEIWLRSGNKPEWAPGVTINTGDHEALSDWMRHITLENVTVCVETRKGSDGKEYPELLIRGGDIGDVLF